MAGRRFRAVLLGLGVVGVLLVVLTAVAVQTRTTWLEALLVRAVAAQGVGPVSLTVESFTSTGVQLRALEIGDGPDLAADGVRLDWSREGVSARRADRVATRGVRVRGRSGEDGISFGALDALLGNTDADAASGRAPEADSEGEKAATRGFVLPVAALEMADTRIELATADGPATLSLSGGFRATPDGEITGRVDLAATHPWASVAGPLEFAGTLDAMELSLEAAPVLNQPPIAVTMKGEPTLRVSATIEAERPLRATVSLTGFDLGLEDPAFGLLGTAIEAQLVGDEITGTLAWDELRDRAAEPALPPLAGTANYTGTVDELDFEAQLAVGPKAVPLTLEGTVQSDGPVVDVVFDLPVTVLGRSGTGVGALVPPLTGTIERWKGRVALTGTGHHDPAATTFDATLTYTGLGLVTESGRIDSLTGTAEVHGRLPADREPPETSTRTGEDGAEAEAPEAAAPPEAPGLVLEHVAFAARGGELTLPDGNFHVDGFAANGQLDGDELKGRLISATLTDRSAEPMLPVLTARMDFAGTTERVTFEGELIDRDEYAHIAIEGRANLERAHADARFHLRPLALGPVGRGLARLLPPLAKQIDSGNGVIEAVGSARLRDALTFQTDFAFKGVGLLGGFGSVTGLNGSIAISGPDPLVTPPGQLLSTGLVDIGLPLADGIVEFELQDGLVAALAKAEWHWAGGVLRTKGPFDLDADENALVLEVVDLDVEALTREVDLDGLEGTGKLHGQLPILLTADSVLIRDGWLESRGPGTLRYPRGTVPGGEEPAGLSVLLDALDDFRYDALGLRIDGDARGEVALEISVSGRNPNLQEGRPVKLSVTVDARFSDLLRSVQETYRIPELIEERLRRFENQETP